MKELQINIASIFAAKVFVGKQVGSIDERRKELNIEKVYSYRNMQKLMEENHELQMNLQ